MNTIWSDQNVARDVTTAAVAYNEWYALDTQLNSFVVNQAPEALKSEARGAESEFRYRLKHVIDTLECSESLARYIVTERAASLRSVGVVAR